MDHLILELISIGSQCTVQNIRYAYWYFFFRPPSFGQWPLFFVGHGPYGPIKFHSRMNPVHTLNLQTVKKLSWPGNCMKLSPLFMEIWSFETIHCLNFGTQRQKHHEVTYDIKVNFLICRFVRCMKILGRVGTLIFLLIFFLEKKYNYMPFWKAKFTFQRS